MFVVFPRKTPDFLKKPGVGKMVARLQIAKVYQRISCGSKNSALGESHVPLLYASTARLRRYCRPQPSRPVPVLDQLSFYGLDGSITAVKAL
jgi:hypothetical protein